MVFLRQLGIELSVAFSQLLGCLIDSSCSQDFHTFINNLNNDHPGSVHPDLPGIQDHLRTAADREPSLLSDVLS